MALYRKGERTPRRIRRDFPHFVEIEIPGSGLRERECILGPTLGKQRLPTVPETAYMDVYVASRTSHVVGTCSVSIWF